MPHPGPLFPVALLLEGRRCLVVGGGAVATRKIQGLLACGARVTVVAPAVAPALDRLAGTAAVPDGALVIEVRSYRSPEAADYRLVVTATGIPAVDHAVYVDAEEAGVWVNSADDLENCSFILPAVHRQGPVSVSVSTGGASPALAGWLRDRVAEVVGPEVAVLADLLGEARASVKASGRSTEDLDWRPVLDELVPLVREGRTGEARELLAAFTGG